MPLAAPLMMATRSPATDDHPFNVSAVRAAGPAEKLVPFVITERGTARPGDPVLGGGVVLSTDQNTRFALDPATGSTKAKVDLGDGTTRFATPSLSNDGHAYVGTQRGLLVIVATS